MWKKDKSLIRGKADVEIIKKGFIIADGSIHLTFANRDEAKTLCNGETLSSLPCSYIFKVHRNHPMRIYSSSHNHVHIYPKDDKRMPAVVAKDKMAYDMTTLLLLPFDIDLEPPKKGKGWEKISKLEDCFVKEDGKKSDASLFYLSHGLLAGSTDTSFWSHTSPSQVHNHTFHWLTRDHSIDSYSKKRPFGESHKHQGEIKIPIDTARGLTNRLAPVLEKRYKTELMFKR